MTKDQNQQILASFVTAALKRAYDNDERKLSNDERLVRRMLRHWTAADLGEPHIIMDSHNNIVGLGPGDPIGAVPRIFIRACDHKEEKP